MKGAKFVFSGLVLYNIFSYEYKLTYFNGVILRYVSYRISCCGIRVRGIEAGVNKQHETSATTATPYRRRGALLTA